MSKGNTPERMEAMLRDDQATRDGLDLMLSFAHVVRGTASDVESKVRDMLVLRASRRGRYLADVRR